MILQARNVLGARLWLPAQFIRLFGMYSSSLQPRHRDLAPVLVARYSGFAQLDQLLDLRRLRVGSLEIQIRREIKDRTIGCRNLQKRKYTGWPASRGRCSQTIGAWYIWC